MKGIILAGGANTRLYPLTTTTSKQLLPVYDRQMIFYPLNILIKAGIKNILIIVTPEHSGQFINLLGSMFDDFGVHIEFKVQKTPRGLADAFILGENFINEDNVTMILGDNVFEDDLAREIKSFQRGGLVFAKEVKDPERFGVVEFGDDGGVISIEEKPEKPKSNFCVTGIYTYNKEVIEIAKSLEPSERGEIEITDINKEYLRRGSLRVGKIKGAWLDAGTFDSLLEANKIVKEKHIYENMDPVINRAIEKFNGELKNIKK